LAEAAWCASAIPSTLAGAPTLTKFEAPGEQIPVHTNVFLEKGARSDQEMAVCALLVQFGIIEVNPSGVLRPLNLGRLSFYNRIFNGNLTVSCGPDCRFVGY
jgi:hypothetical protein